jgi:hypothetical protein
MTITTYGATFDQDTSREPTQSIWQTVPWADIRYLNKGFDFFDDFHHAGAVEASTVFAWNGGTPAMPYKAFGTAGVTFNASGKAADNEIGVLKLDTDANNDNAYLTFDATYGSPWGKITDTAADITKVWFEGRVRFASVADTLGAYCFGLRDVVDAASNDIADAGADFGSGLSDFVGFRVAAGDGNGMDVVHRKTDTTVIVTEASVDTKLVIVADTFIKLGLYYDGKKCHWYVNGVEVGTGVLPAATNFPDDTPLMPVYGGRQDGSGDTNHEIDWWKYAIVYPV